MREDLLGVTHKSNHMRVMTDDELVRCKEFLDYFSVPYDGDYIPQTDGGNSIVCNPNTQFKEFLGHSVNSVARAVAEKLDKPLKWIE